MMMVMMMVMMMMMMMLAMKNNNDNDNVNILMLATLGITCSRNKMPVAIVLSIYSSVDVSFNFQPLKKALKDKVLAGSCESRGSESRVHGNEVEVLKGLWVVPQGTHTFVGFYIINPAA